MLIGAGCSRLDILVCILGLSVNLAMESANHNSISGAHCALFNNPRLDTKRRIVNENNNCMPCRYNAEKYNVGWPHISIK